MTLKYFTIIYGVVISTEKLWNFLHQNRPYENEDEDEVSEFFYENDIMSSAGYGDLYSVKLSHDQSEKFFNNEGEFIACGINLGNTKDVISVEMHEYRKSLVDNFPLFEKEEKKFYMIANDCICCT